MDLYTFSLALGSAGLGVMGLSGIGHHFSQGHAGAHHGAPHHGGVLRGHQAGHTHAGHTQAGHAHGAGHALAHTGAHQAAGHHGQAPAPGAPLARALWAVVSPRVVFSFLVGFGATGFLLRGALSGLLLVAVAGAGGLAFERLIVAPLWRSLLRFASAPALTLESCIADEVRAVSGFDAEGNGLVAAELDGQLVQLLGTLRPEDRAAGVRVRAGDRLRVEDVDGARNRCTVSYLGR
jgi:hypothetical protein